MKKQIDIFIGRVICLFKDKSHERMWHVQRMVAGALGHLDEESNSEGGRL